MLLQYTCFRRVCGVQGSGYRADAHASERVCRAYVSKYTYIYIYMCVEDVYTCV